MTGRNLSHPYKISPLSRSELVKVVFVLQMNWARMGEEARIEWLTKLYNACEKMCLDIEEIMRENSSDDKRR